MCEYASDREWVSDGGEQGAVAVAVWAAQDVLVKYARDQCRPAICGGAGVVFGKQRALPRPGNPFIFYNGPPVVFHRPQSRLGPTKWAHRSYLDPRSP